MLNAYTTLGLRQDADNGDVIMAFETKMMEYRVRLQADSSEGFVLQIQALVNRIIAARTLLLDPKRRAELDTSLAEQRRLREKEDALALRHSQRSTTEQGYLPEMMPSGPQAERFTRWVDAPSHHELDVSA